MSFAVTDHLGVSTIILTGGFPCKDVSKLNYFHIVRILRILRRITGNMIHFLLERTLMDDEALQRINLELDCFPLNINSVSISAARRNRLYWCSFEIELCGTEAASATPSMVNIKLQDSPHRLQILDDGASFHAQFSGSLDFFIGFQTIV